ncbi:MAG: DDE-type integrase/transposase/recombinase [Anaerolineae bacterium]|nr:DDE-type integrase/transposase/recombinase [Anaerolineae bacterium]MBT7073160.1 DDE-type integrase/transposase/recombinase [Anaerolineae bacterium]MBT7326614.1 DDE-type integrase/transposase/recombinase [Anaerolineae bacterium]
MQKLNIRSVARKDKPYRRSSQMESHHRYENVLDREFTAAKPNQKWVTDISYVRTQQGWAYLSTIKELFDGFIVAYLLGKQHNIALVTNTLKQALQREKVTNKLLLHSDQGFQYRSYPYFDKYPALADSGEIIH